MKNFEVQALDSKDYTWVTILIYDTFEEALNGLIRHINSRMNTYGRIRIIATLYEWNSNE